MFQLPLTCGISAVHVRLYFVFYMNRVKRTETNLKTPKHSIYEMQLEEMGFVLPPHINHDLPNGLLLGTFT